MKVSQQPLELVSASPADSTSGASRLEFIDRDNCELCGSADKEILYRQAFTAPQVWSFIERYYQGRVARTELAGADYEIAVCGRCGFLWQTHVLAAEGMRRLYNEWISPGESLRKKETADVSLFSRYAAELEAVCHLTQSPPCELNVLDFGMGWGHWCRMARAFGLRATGLEVSSDRIHFAGGQGIQTIDSLSSVSHQFDFINSDQVFEHIPDPLTALRPLVDVLRPGGLIRLSVPDGRGMRRGVRRPRWRPSKDALHPLEHVNCFTHRTLIEMARQAGLEMISQPLVAYPSRSLRGHFGNIAIRYYRRYFSTSLYFCKSN